MISENQGLEKLRSALNLRKISGPTHLQFFFQFVTWIFFRFKSSFFSRRSPWKKSRFAGPENFLRFETDLDFSRPWFSEIKVQIKRPCIVSTPQITVFALYIYYIYLQCTNSDLTTSDWFIYSSLTKWDSSWFSYKDKNRLSGYRSGPSFIYRWCKELLILFTHMLKPKLYIQYSGSYIV